MKKLWLTYSWQDNVDANVDFVIQELKEAGVDVKFDRASLIPGRPLWDQIAHHITNKEESEGWALLATPASLESEPCREELRYALDRALHARGQTYPLIGIFKDCFDREALPPSLRVRLCVSLHDRSWKTDVVAALEGKAPGRLLDVEPFYSRLHHSPQGSTLEVGPRIGAWASVRIARWTDQPQPLVSPAWVWVSARNTNFAAAFIKRACTGVRRVDGNMSQVESDQGIDSNTSLFINLTPMPQKVQFGSLDQQFELSAEQIRAVSADSA